MQLDPTTIDRVAQPVEQAKAQPIKAESGWSGRKIALVVLGTIAAIASVVGTVFLVMMLTKKKEGESLEGENAPLQLVAKHDEEKGESANVLESKQNEKAETNSTPLSHPQKTRPKFNHRLPTRFVKDQGSEKPSTQTNELSLSQFIELPVHTSADTSKDLEMALKLQQELDGVSFKPVEDTSQDEAIAFALAQMESGMLASALPQVKAEVKQPSALPQVKAEVKQPSALPQVKAEVKQAPVKPSSKHDHHAKKYTLNGTTIVLPHGVTKANYVPWAFAEAKKNWVKTH